MILIETYNSEGVVRDHIEMCDNVPLKSMMIGISNPLVVISNKLHPNDPRLIMPSQGKILICYA